MERQFNACQTPRSPSNYNRFWDRARYLWKNRHFIIPALHSTPPLGGFPSEYRHPLWYGKTRMVSLPDGEKNSNICLFEEEQLSSVPAEVTVRRKTRRSFLAVQRGSTSQWSTDGLSQEFEYVRHTTTSRQKKIPWFYRELASLVHHQHNA